MDRKEELDSEVAERGLTAQDFINARDKLSGKKTELGEEQLLSDLVKAFVFKPEKVQVSSVVDDREGGVTIMTLNVDRDDYGVVVGKEARKIQALRILVQLFGAKTRREFRLIMPERERSGSYLRAEIIPDLNWHPDGALALLRRVLNRILAKAYDIKVVGAGGQTHFEVIPEKGEREWLERLQPYVHTVFHAIGKAQGHELYVEVQSAAVAKP